MLVQGSKFKVQRVFHTDNTELTDKAAELRVKSNVLPTDLQDSHRFYIFIRIIRQLKLPIKKVVTQIAQRSQINFLSK